MDVRYRTKVSNIAQSRFSAGGYNPRIMPDQTVRFAVEQVLDSLATTPFMPPRCPKCSSPMISVAATFVAPGGKTWNVPLPACPHCDLKNDTAMFVPEMDC
jgi:hypothetical protein